MQSAANEVLAGIDFSENSLAAFRVACELASRRGWRLRLVHTIPTGNIKNLAYVFGEAEPAFRAKLIAKAQADLETIVGNRKTGVPIEVAVTVGGAAHEILREARERRPSLVVLGKTGGLAASEGIGTVAGKCSRMLSVPLLLVDGAGPGMPTSMVVFVDLSAAARPAIREGLRLAGDANCDCRLVHLLCLPLATGSALGLVAGGFQERSRQLESDARRRLEELVRGCEGPSGQKRACEILVCSDVGEGLGRTMATFTPDLVVIGRPKVKGAGSFAERAVGRLACSMLLVSEDEVDLLVP